MTVKLTRKTKETQISLELDPGNGEPAVKTPDPFLTHMVSSLAKHGRFGLRLTAESRDEDPHHLAEDVALTLGQAFKTAFEGHAIRRFAHEVIPMDDALVGTYLDFGGRGFYEGRLPSPMYEHFLRSFAHEAGLTLHVNVIRGRDEHHVTEAAFKGLGRCLRVAVEPAPGVQSTKGQVETRGG